MTTSKGGRPATGSIRWRFNPDPDVRKFQWFGRVKKADGSRPWAPLDPSILEHEEERARASAVETAAWFRDNPHVDAGIKETIGDGMRLDASEITLAPLKTVDSISGLTIAIAGVRFNLVMRDVGPRRTGALDDRSIRHPNELLFVDATRSIERSICFTWPRNLEGGQVTLGWRAAPSGT